MIGPRASVDPASGYLMPISALRCRKVQPGIGHLSSTSLYNEKILPYEASLGRFGSRIGTAPGVLDDFSALNRKRADERQKWRAQPQER